MLINKHLLFLFCLPRLALGAIQASWVSGIAS
jgi:hypothetical protein